MKKSLLACSLFIFLVSSKCNKDKISSNVLPPPTQQGLDIFACNLNDSVWISEQGIDRMNAVIRHDTLGIRGSRTNPDKSIDVILINLTSVFDVNRKSYDLNDTAHSCATYVVTGYSNCITSSSGYGGGGVKKSIGGHLLFTKIDTVHKILSGTFDFQILTDYCDTFKFTDGRFDLKLH
jgi:hypothetical protein